MIFESNGGSSVLSQTVDHGKCVTEPEAPTRTGYTFAGWYTEASGGTEYDFTAAVTEDITLYAHWMIDEDSATETPSESPEPTETVTETPSETPEPTETASETPSESPQPTESGGETSSEAPSEFPSETPVPQEIKYGDVNQSNEVEVADALLILRAYVGLSELTPEQEQAADVDGIPGVSVSDALYVLRYYVGLIDKFPVEEL